MCKRLRMIALTAGVTAVLCFGGCDQTAEPVDVRVETESVSESESESEKETTKLSEYLEGLADVYIEVGSSKVDYMDGLKYDKKVITGIEVDDSKVNTKQAGVYTLRYILSGRRVNGEIPKETVTSKVFVVKKEEAQKLADAGVAVETDEGVKKNSKGEEVTRVVSVQNSSNSVSGGNSSSSGSGTVVASSSGTGSSSSGSSGTAGTSSGSSSSTKPSGGTGNTGNTGNTGGTSKPSGTGSSSTNTNTNTNTSKPSGTGSSSTNTNTNTSKPSGGSNGSSGSSGSSNTGNGNSSSTKPSGGNGSGSGETGTTTPSTSSTPSTPSKPVETNPPQTNPPETQPPQTEPPQTNPPETEPPQTEPQGEWVHHKDPIYDLKCYSICNGCGQDITGFESAHAYEGMLAGTTCGNGFWSKYEQVVVGYNEWDEWIPY